MLIPMYPELKEDTGLVLQWFFEKSPSHWAKGKNDASYLFPIVRCSYRTHSTAAILPAPALPITSNTGPVVSMQLPAGQWTAAGRTSRAQSPGQPHSASGALT